MKIDREKMRRYASLDDGALWGEVRRMAENYGYTLPSETPEHSDMERLRRILRGEEKISLTEGMRILTSYKQKSK